MVIPDANLLIYAYDAGSPHLSKAKSWLENALSADEDFGLPIQVILAFIRISTNGRLWKEPSTMATALSRVDAWLDQPQTFILAPGARHWDIFKELCIAAGINGNLSTDAHLAALAIEQGATLYSADNDFGLFPGLRWTNPLAS